MISLKKYIIDLMSLLKVSLLYLLSVVFKCLKRDKYNLFI